MDAAAQLRIDREARGPHGQRRARGPGAASGAPISSRYGRGEGRAFDRIVQTPPSRPSTSQYRARGGHRLLMRAGGAASGIGAGPVGGAPISVAGRQAVHRRHSRRHKLRFEITCQGPPTPYPWVAMDDIPPITGDTARTAEVVRSLPLSGGADLKAIRATFGLALHMHQPTVLADGERTTAPLISNLQYMFDHPGQGDNHNAPVFLHCYGRVANLVGVLVARGRRPRLMLDYSGNLLWGLAQMGQTDVLAALRRTTEAELSPSIEWLGTMWSHAVVSSTPVPDLELHMLAWRHHFAALFGLPALARVRGFSAPEMHLPIHPDVCFAYVRALRACGYRWLMVQEHTVENTNGTALRQPRLPHLLVARNSDGETASIPVLVKTQGSDTKLVGQMQPFGEARSLDRQPFADTAVPPYSLQIGDGENGGVMMNEFPSAYERAFDELGAGGSGVAAMNGTEYLEALAAMGVDERAFPPCNRCRSIASGSR